MIQGYTPKKITRSEGGRRIAIGDIHGCFYAFKSLLQEQLIITRMDQIFLLGDTIDRGCNSALVLDLILDLQKNGYQIFPLKGNHEEKFLAAYNCGFDFFEQYLEQYNSLDLLGDNLEVYLKMIYNFEYCIELDKFVLSHCGINDENRINPFTDLRGMFSRVNFRFKEELFQKNQVHGHLVRTRQEIENSVRNNENRFSIDSGCYLNQANFGYLTALDLDNRKLYHAKRKQA